MNQYLIGTNLPDATTIAGFDAELARIEEDGFDVCEINLSTLPLIIGGEVQPKTIEYVRGIFRQHHLRYTAHAPYGLDLRSKENPEMQRAVLFACIDVCSALGIILLNLHYEVQSMYSEVERSFLEVHKEAAAYAQEKGVLLTIENIEIEHAGKAADFVREVNHPNLGMNLDLGHLFLSAQHYGYDFLETVKDCAPLMRHIHINDNTGDFEPLRVTNYDVYRTLDRGYRFAFGRGDIHIPPFWGKVPIKEALSIIKAAGYTGVWLCEYYSRNFIPFNRDVQEQVRRAVEEA